MTKMMLSSKPQHPKEIEMRYFKIKHNDGTVKYYDFNSDTETLILLNDLQPGEMIKIIDREEFEVQNGILKVFQFRKRG